MKHYNFIKKLSLIFATLNFISACSVRPDITKQQKYAYINANVLLEEFIEARKANKELEKEKDLYVQAINVIKDSLQGAADSIQKMMSTPQFKADAGKRKNAEAVIQESQQRLNLMTQNAEARLQQSRERVMAPVSEKVNRFLESYAQREGYAFIFNLSSNTFAYADKGADITEKIVNELNVKYKE